MHDLNIKFSVIKWHFFCYSFVWPTKCPNCSQEHFLNKRFLCRFRESQTGFLKKTLAITVYKSGRKSRGSLYFPLKQRAKQAYKRNRPYVLFLIAFAWILPNRLKFSGDKYYSGSLNIINSWLLLN